MSKLTLPKLQAPHVSGVSFDIAPTVLARWNSALVAKEDGEDEATISIYDPIGFDPFTGGGFSVKKAAAILRNIGDRDVVVNINSPGGDLFEGIAIYNLLLLHKGKVTVRVIGLAASAASVIAMAGDEIQMSPASFMMIHNVWVVAIGNRNDLRDAADQLETFDDALADVYSQRTSMDKKSVAKMMDKETWFSGSQAMENGFADSMLDAEEVEEKEGGRGQASLRAVDTELARAGIPRARRRALIQSMKELGGTHDAAALHDRGTQDATPKATQDAGALSADDIRATAERISARVQTL